MLILSRLVGQELLLDDRITIRLILVTPNYIKLSTSHVGVLTLQKSETVKLAGLKSTFIMFKHMRDTYERVNIAIEAPRSIRIMRSELLDGV